MKQETQEEIIQRFETDKLSDNEMNEVIKIGKLFYERFVIDDILKKDSTVVFNPSFGTWGRLFGAEGDLYIDGTIYDLKSRNKAGHRQEDICISRAICVTVIAIVWFVIIYFLFMTYFS